MEKKSTWIAKFSWGVVLPVVFVLVFARAQNVFAASLYFSPQSGSEPVGQSFTVGVYVSSPDRAMNAAEGTVNFPTDKLSAISISTADSIMNLWVQQPSFSNNDGTINFQGVAVNPGFTGAAGRVLTVTFRAKSAGVAAVVFNSGSVLANDGSGTNVLTSMPSASFTVVPGSAVPAPVSQNKNPNQNTPSTPVVSSNTHPDENQWYNAKTLQLSWPLPSGVTGVSYALYSTSNFALPSTSKGVLSSVSYDLTAYREGTWYFYAKFQNANGWGPTTMRRVHIDVTPPLPFPVSEVDNGDPTDPRPVFAWGTSDSLSGMDKYLVKIGAGDWFDAAAIAVSSTPGEYQVPLQAPGDNIQFAVGAYDNAGNVVEATTTFSVAPLPTPEILSYPAKIGSSNQLLDVRGLVQPKGGIRATTIRLYLQRSGTIMSFSAPVDQNGNWDVARSVNLSGGQWVLTAQATDDRGSLSMVPPPVTVSVGGWVDDIISFLVSWSAVIIAGILLFAVIIAIAYGVIHAVRRWRLSLDNRLIKSRKEFRDDLARIEKELEADQAGRRAALSPSELRKRRELIRLEIEHLEKDIQKDAKDNAGE